MKSYKLENLEMWRVTVKIKDDFGYQQYQITADKRTWKKNMGSHLTNYFFCGGLSSGPSQIQLEICKSDEISGFTSTFARNPFLQWSMDIGTVC